MSRPKAQAARKAKGEPSEKDGPLALAFFDKVLGGPSWQAWRVWLQAVFGLPISDADREAFTRSTARDMPPTSPAREAWVVAGRRSGKSRMAAFLAAFMAAVRQYRLAPGERGVVLIVAPARRQAAVILDYTAAFVRMLPGVTIERETTDELELSTGIVIAVQTASFRTPRGFTCVGAIVDEIAFLRTDDAAQPDREILRAVRPSLATVPGSLLLAISSPYAQRGALYDTYERAYGRPGDVLVWQSPTAAMNPTVPAALIEQALDEDPAAASAEWLAEFRADLESLFSRSALDAVVVRGRFELPKAQGVAYVGFVDPSGGSADSFTLAIAHRDPTGRPVLDLVRETRPPFSPEAVCQQYAADLKRYGCSAVYSDNYAAEWPRERFQRAGIFVTPSPLTRSELYLELLPMLNSGGIELLDDSRLVGQLAGLERRAGRSGRDAVDHRPGSKDDVANAAAGALVMAVRSVGLQAPLPTDFVACVSAGASAANSCPFLGTGAYWPSDPHCHRECAGLRGVKPAYAAYRAERHETGERALDPRAYLNEYFDLDSSPVTLRAVMRQAQNIADALF